MHKSICVPKVGLLEDSDIPRISDEYIISRAL